MDMRGLRKLYAEFIKVWNIGYSAGIGRFYGMINIILMASTFLIVKGFELSFTETIILAGVMFIFIISFGIVYVKFGFQKAEFSTQFKEQPELYEMSKRVERIESMLLELKDKQSKPEPEEMFL